MNVPDESALRHLNASLNLDALWMPFTANRQGRAALTGIGKGHALSQILDCGGALKIIADIEDPPAIIKILSHKGLPPHVPAHVRDRLRP